jgi:endonuclease-3
MKQKSGSEETMEFEKGDRYTIEKQTFHLGKIAQILSDTVESWATTPYVTECANETRDPFRVLISTILSLRTKDEATKMASTRLFALADTPQSMLRLSPAVIEQAIFPVGFYKTKARTILDICGVLIAEYDGRVPDEIDELLKLKGVGRKTANLVVTLAYGKPGICVDTHVHRICNRLWAIQTKDPEQTELWLRQYLPKKFWIPINTWMVVFGQRLCQPVSPWCSKCPLQPDCQRWGVTRSR